MLPDCWLFAGLEVLGLTYVTYVLAFQHIVVKYNIFQVRGKKHDRAMIIESYVLYGNNTISLGTYNLRTYWKGLKGKVENNTKIAILKIGKGPKR